MFFCRPKMEHEEQQEPQDALQLRHQNVYRLL